MDITKCIARAGSAINKYSPEIFTGLTIVGAVSSVVFAIRSTPKALRDIDYEKQRRADDILKKASELNEEGNTDPQYDKYYNEEGIIDMDMIRDDAETLKASDYIRICWKTYLPSTLMLMTSVISAIMSNYISSARNSTTAALLATSQETLHLYQEKVIDEIGKKKEEKIRSEVNKERLKKNPPKGGNIIITGNGNYLCLDTFSGRYFRSTKDKIMRAENEINAQILRNMSANLNDFYDLIGLEPTNAGSLVGWQAPEQMCISYDCIMSGDENDSQSEPCCVVDIDPNNLKEDYDKVNN